MDTISGMDAMRRAEAVSKTGGDFTLAFFPYSRTKKNDDVVKLRTFEHCTLRTPLPHDKFDIDGKHYLLFNTGDLKPRSCYRVLVRYIGFSTDAYKLQKIQWYE